MKCSLYFLSQSTFYSCLNICRGTGFSFADGNLIPIDMRLVHQFRKKYLKFNSEFSSTVGMAEIQIWNQVICVIMYYVSHFTIWHTHTQCSATFCLLHSRKCVYLFICWQVFLCLLRLFSFTISSFCCGEIHSLSESRRRSRIDPFLSFTPDEIL